MNTLHDIPLFADLSKKDAEYYATRCLWTDYSSGELIIDHMDQSADVRFIISGQIRVIVRMAEGREVILNESGPGHFFGELSAIDGQQRSASVTAITNSRMCVMPSSIFREIVESSPKVGWAVLERLTELVRGLSERLAEYSFLQAKHRIYVELLRLSHQRPGHPGQRSISPPPVQREIADRVASRREVVSRVMKNLERKSILEKTKGALVILDVKALNALISEGWNG